MPHIRVQYISLEKKSPAVLIEEVIEISSAPIKLNMHRETDEITIELTNDPLTLDSWLKVK